jgi:hypothetical protein
MANPTTTICILFGFLDAGMYDIMCFYFVECTAFLAYRASHSPVGCSGGHRGEAERLFRRQFKM